MLLLISRITFWQKSIVAIRHLGKNNHTANFKAERQQRISVNTHGAWSLGNFWRSFSDIFWKHNEDHIRSNQGWLQIHAQKQIARVWERGNNECKCKALFKIEIKNTESYDHCD